VAFFFKSCLEQLLENKTNLQIPGPKNFPDTFKNKLAEKEKPL